MAAIIIAMSAVPDSSRTECMPSDGLPTSTVGTARPPATIGPMVEPLRTPLRLTKYWTGTPWRRFAA